MSSPGYGVIDSGCGRTLIGRSTLDKLQVQLTNLGQDEPLQYPHENVFRFGNGQTETSLMSVRIPVGICKRFGYIDAAVIEGRAPLLLGRPSLEKLEVGLDFANRRMNLLKQSESVPMVTNQAGQLLVNILDFPSAEACARARSKCALQAPATNKSSPSKPAPISPSDKSSEPRRASHPRDQPVIKCTPPREKSKVSLKRKECRCLLAQFRRCEMKSSRVAVAELFSPPRFAKAAKQIGLDGLSFDIQQGWDLLDPSVQEEVDAMLDEACPELLVVCPPCTYWGGWDNLNQYFRTAAERARLIRIARQQVRFCERQIRKQLDRGGDFLFEHPLRSRVWKSPILEYLVSKFGVNRIDMCAFGLQCPDSHRPIQKQTGLMFSRSELARVLKLCPGCPEHQTIAGRTQSGQLLSAFTASYTPKFVRSFLLASVPTALQAREIALADLDLECLAADAPASDQEEQQDHSRIDAALKKLHSNLGHPSQRELIRVLKHS